MRWIRSKLRILAFSVLVLMSVAEVRSRSHGTLYASTTADALLTESRRVAMVHEAPAQHLDHIDLSEYAELGVPPDSLTAPPSRGGVSASNPPLTILVPLYNEAPSVPAFLERLLAISAHYQVEAVAVDDGSKDDTLLRVAEAPPGLIRLSHNEISLGYLSALREGVRTTTQSVIVILDAHAPINTHVMARLLDALSAPQTVAVACPVFPGRSRLAPTLGAAESVDHAGAPLSLDRQNREQPSSACMRLQARISRTSPRPGI